MHYAHIIIYYIGTRAAIPFSRANVRNTSSLGSESDGKRNEKQSSNYMCTRNNMYPAVIYFIDLKAPPPHSKKKTSYKKKL